MPVRDGDSKPQRQGHSSFARATLALSLASSLMMGGQGEAFAEGPAPASSASPAVSAPSPAEPRELAKARYEQGVEAYQSDRYADAVRLFLEADAISPSAALSYNIARAYEKLSDDAQTLRWYRNYLRLNPRANNATEVQGYVRTLSQALAKKGIQQLTVLSTPPGATVAIDGSPLGVTPLSVELKPGAHTALLSMRGFSDAASNFDLPAGAPLDVTVTLSRAPKQSAPSAPEGQSGRRFGIAPYITLGVASACLIGAGAFEISRRSAQNSAKSEVVQLDVERDLDAVNSRRTTARVLLGVGSVLAVTGATLLVFNRQITPESRAVVSAVPGGAILGLVRSF